MRFLKKLFWIAIMGPIGVVLATLMVINRHVVGFVYNPFLPRELAPKIELPFYY